MKYSEIVKELKLKMTFCFDDSVCFSYPVPDVINGIRVDKVFLYRKSVEKMGTRPFALLTTDSNSGEILSFENSRISDFVDSEKHPFSYKLDYSMPEKENIQDFKMEQQMIRKLYEGIRTFAFSNEVSPEQKELLEKYTFILSHAIPKDLLPFYEKLSPKYTEWLCATIDNRR